MISNRKSYYILIGLILFINTSIQAQDQQVADSLKVIYEANDLRGQERMDILRLLTDHEMNDLTASLTYSDELIRLATAEKNNLFLCYGYISRGNTYRVLGDFDRALEALFKSAEAAKRANSLKDEATSYVAIADTFSEIGNATNAELYYHKGIALFRKLDRPIPLATALLNAGDELFNNKKYDQALQNFEESGAIFKESNHPIGAAYTKGNIGMVYAEQGKHRLAEEKINEALNILEGFQDYYAISEYLTYMSDIYMKEDDLIKALNYAERSLELANKIGLKKQISESNLTLSELHEQAGNLAKSFAFYKNHIKYRDSIINVENIESMANQRTNYEVFQKQVEVDRLNDQKLNQRTFMYATGIALFLIGLLAIGFFKRYRYIQNTNTIIAKEKERSDSLLLNILPEETAKELKEYGKVRATKFEAITVLFTDFVGFTHYAENLQPEILVESVDFYFSRFDRIMEKYKLEKIKTVGDAYMCAGGLHHPKEGHAKRMVQAAIDITNFVKSVKKQYSKTSPRFDIRIGINTGPLVAGVVGTNKFAYDIWGDSVNIASRMESNSEAGRINISENTYALIKDDYDCEFRGEIIAKNRGRMKMYFVNSRTKTKLENVVRKYKKNQSVLSNTNF